ncbi:MAG: glycosyltransferase family 4 protein, partial [Rhodovibrionaceae bacterium]
GTLYRPDPLIAPQTWQRRHGDQRGFSICGVTHTTSSEGAMAGLAELLSAPVQPWDAVICTSEAVRDMVLRQIESQAAYLESRFGVRATLACQTPVIPLGVHSDDYAATPGRRAAGQALRQRLGIAEADIAGLFLGRLSFHAKANPFPMYSAMQAAAVRSGRRLHLIQAGWFANDWIETAFKEAAAEIAPEVTCHFLDGGDPAVRSEVWHAADLFLSFSDNIQETYGLTPLEAMAAGLPVVVSDWDGYRQTVRPEIDGLTVPTWQPQPGSAPGLARSFAAEMFNYDHYIGYASQSVAVEIDAAAEAVTRLVEDAELRRKLGAAGARRAREVFDWRHVIAAYQALWGELAARRARDTEVAPLGAAETAPHPSRGDPTRLFAGYPTEYLGKDTVVTLASDVPETRLAALEGLKLASFGAERRLPARHRQELLAQLSAKPLTLKALLAELPEADREAAIATLAWLAKLGVVRLSRSGGKDD